ncbi:hypothetical protein Nmel_002980 [Mimus melanotis]
MLCTLILPGARPLQIQLRGLIDTRADVMVISLSAWSLTLPMVLLGQAIEGLGGATPTFVRLTTAQLSPLFYILKGDSHLDSFGILTPEARQALKEVQQALSTHQVYQVDPSIDITVFITNPGLHPTGIIGQSNDKWSDPFHILEWVFLPHQLKKTVTTVFELFARLIIKCHQRCLQLIAADPAKNFLPVEWEFFEGSFVNSVPLQSVLQDFTGQIAYHLPSHKLFQMVETVKLSLRPKNSWVPVQGLTIFTDGSGKTGKAIASDRTHLPQVKVFICDLTTNKWEGLHELIVWGRRYACVSTDTGVHWLSARCVRPDL